MERGSGSRRRSIERETDEQEHLEPERRRKSTLESGERTEKLGELKRVSPSIKSGS